MGIGRWATWDRLMRALHLYTSLFLAPWMMVYAISAFCLNHHTWFEKLQPQWKTVRETTFQPDASLADPDERTRALLKHLDLEGAYRFMGTPDANQMSILRMSSAGHYRIVWRAAESHVVVDRQQPFSFYSLVNSLHFQHRYDQRHVAYVTWAIVVDAVTISTVIWVISGIYLWARRPSKRRLGGICLAAGTALFAALAILLCR